LKDPSAAGFPTMDALPVSFFTDGFVGDFVFCLPARCLIGSGATGSSGKQTVTSAEDVEQKIYTAFETDPYVLT